MIDRETVLHARDGDGALGLSELVQINVRHANLADPSLTLQVGKGTHAFLDRKDRVRPMQMVEIDGVDAESTQARLSPMCGTSTW